jgi:hypothetical protein
MIIASVVSLMDAIRSLRARSCLSNTWRATRARNRCTLARFVVSFD